MCGAARPADAALLVGADLVGLWCGVPGGHADLSPAAIAELAGAITTTTTARPVLVTLSTDVGFIATVAATSGIRWVQLHGYQQPGTVRRLKSAVPGLTVIKVLHLHDTDCVELRLLGSYQRSGVDMFLLDAVAPDGTIGSTGCRVDPTFAMRVADAISIPFLLAGGISAINATGQRTVRNHAWFAGVDVDNGSRDAAGRFDPARIDAIRRQWTIG